MTALSAREAYRFWAPTYSAETAITVIDDELVAALSPSPRGKNLLDAGCGTGRRLPQGCTLAVGVDASPEMLAAGGGVLVAAADIRALPFADGQFDLVWCRLVLGHLADPAPAYRELARVCCVDGQLLVTDFHPQAVAAGHKRRLRDTDGAWHEVEHYLHDAHAHRAMAEASGLAFRGQRDGVIGPLVEPLYRRAGRQVAYQRDRCLAVVAAYCFARCDS